MKNGVSTRTDRVDLQRHPRFPRGVSEAGSKALAEHREVRVHARLQLTEGPQPGGHRQRVAGQRAGLIHGAGGRDKRHQVGPSAVRADGQAAADDLPEAREIRGHARQRLRSARRRAETGDHLVEDRAATRAAVHMLRSARRKPSAGGTTPMLPAIGSTITAAIAPRLASNTRPTDSRSL